MDQYMGNLFYRGVCPSVINEMSFFEMKEWNKWHERIAEQERKTAEEMKSGGKKKKSTGGNER